MVSAAPKVESTVNAVCRMLQAHGHTRACFVAHSLGTTLLAWMLHSEEGTHTCIHIHTYIHTYIHITTNLYKHVCFFVLRNPIHIYSIYIHTYTTYIYYIQYCTYIYTYIHTFIYSIHIYVHRYIRIYIHTPYYIHAYIHTYIQRISHTYTYRDT